MALTGWTLEGTDLRTLGYDMSVKDGWDGVPGLKAASFAPAYRHGYRMAQGRTVYEDRDITLSLTIFPYDPITGAITTTPEEHIEENLETLMSLLYSDDWSVNNGLTLVKTLPSGLEKSIKVFPVQAIPIQEEGLGPLALRMVLILNAPYPFWHGGPQEVHTGLTGAFNLDNDGSAPINDMVITFTNAATLAHSTGVEVTSTQAGLVLDVGKNTITGGDDNDVVCSHGWVMEMKTGTNAFTSTAGIAISYYHGYLT